MKLKMTREHFVKKGVTWVPKQAFATEAEIKERLGFDPDKCLIYKCTMCDLLHLYSPDRWKRDT